MTSASRAEGFWSSAWAVEELLQAGHEVYDDKDATLLDSLREDLNLQRFIFTSQQFSDANWLALLKAHGVFDRPPEVERVDGGLRAHGWPALDYLKAVAAERPAEVANLIGAIESDNWWVLSDALSIASMLPSDTAVHETLGLLRQWSRAEVQWTQPEVLLDVIAKLASDDGDAALREALFRVIDGFLRDRMRHYEMSELLPDLQVRLGPSLSTALADSIEEVVALRLADGSQWRVSRSLDDLRGEEGPDSILGQWLVLLEVECDAYGGHAPLRRAIRLLRSRTTLQRLMGMRALSASLGLDDSEPIGVELLEDLANEDGVTRRFEELPELVRLFGTHFVRLSRTTQERLLLQLQTQCVSDEAVDRYHARDWLHAVRAHLSAIEIGWLEELVQELGPAQEDFGRMSSVGSWVGPRSPVATADLESMEIPDLLGILSHPPIEVATEWPYEGGSPEGLGRALQPVMKDRIESLWPHLGSLAEATRHPSVLHSLAWGIRDAFDDPQMRTAERLGHVVEFVSVAVRRARQGGFEVDEEQWASSHAVGRALADLVERLGDWFATSDQPDTVAEALSWLLASDDPPLDAEDDDPPSRAINSVRGEAVLASLRIRAAFWGPSALEETPLRDAVSGLLAENLRTERSPAVLSSYGRYLAPIVVYWGDFFEEMRDLLLPVDDESIPQWSAVLGTYVTFSNPHRVTARRLRVDYELAVERLGDLTETFLGKHSERLLMHLVALALPRADDAHSWEQLLQVALGRGSASTNTRAIHDLAFAIEREGAEVPAEWVRAFVDRRARAIANSLRVSRAVPDSGASIPENEPGALLELLFAARVSVQESIGVIRSLLNLGARPRIDDAVGYLTAVDPALSQSGADVLLLSIRQAGRDAYIRSMDEVKELVGRYAQTQPETAWEIVNALAERGDYRLQETARLLSAQLRSA